MAGIFNGPARGGTRGGASEFSWENVKSDQDREYYLGHSVKALTGRWQKGKDVYWYTREKDTGDDADARRRAEMQMVKQREEDLMLEALGMKPKAPKQIAQPKLDKEDMQKLMAREEGEGGGQGSDGDNNPDRIRGLGFNASRTTGAIQMGTDQEIMQGVGMNRPVYSATAAAVAGPAGGAGPSGRSAAGVDKETQRRLRKEEKKLEKRARKESKRAKKDSKRSKRGRSRSRSRSFSPSNSDLSGEGGGRGRERERGVEHDGSREGKDHVMRDRSPVVHRAREDNRRRERSRSRSPRKRSRSPVHRRREERREERYDDERGRRDRSRERTRGGR